MYPCWTDKPLSTRQNAVYVQNVHCVQNKPSSLLSEHFVLSEHGRPAFVTTLAGYLLPETHLLSKPALFT